MEVYVHHSAAPKVADRIAEGMLALLRRALAGPGESFLICEDDVLFDPRLRTRLEAWAPWRAGAVRMASLYNPGAFGAAEAGFPDAIVVDAEQALGSQARLFSRACAEHVAREFRPSAWIQDVAVARLAAQCGPLLYHVPSLVQHTGRESTWGGPFHEALDFHAAA